MNMSSKSTSETEEKNPYILLREAKIARNKARLEELGLARSQVTSSVVLTSVDSDSMKQDVTRKRKSYSGKKTLQSDEPVSMPPPRRSSRLQNLGAITSTDDDKNHNGKSKSSTQTQILASMLRKGKQISDDGTTGISTSQNKSTRRNKGTSSLNPNSTKLKEINIQHILFGKSSPPTIFSHSYYKVGILGRMIELIGKGPVVQYAGLLDSEIVSIFSFNKYSGITEWKNDVLFLWINIGGEMSSDSIINEFLDDGKQITWFGGSKMHNDTPVIQKLIRIGIQAKSKNSDTSNKSGIVLWCRMYDKQRRCYRPYACLGRLSYDSHDPGSYPVKFIFNLLDFDKLLKSTVFKCMINNVDIPMDVHTSEE